MPLASIWAQTRKGVIGRAGTIPWRYRGDLQRFKFLTVGGTVIMGRRTFQSIGKPLPGRHNVIVQSPGAPIPEGSAASWTTAPTLALAIEAARWQAKSLFMSDRTWFIGGARIYAEAMDHVDFLDVTVVPDVVDDGPEVVYAPRIHALLWKQVSEEPHPDEPALTLQRWERR